MINADELKKVKEKRKINLYYAEKEYLQYIFLNAISRHGDRFIFKGGTCLRIAYELERASEDLDFSTSLKLPEIKDSINNCLKDYKALNIKYEVYSEKKYKGNLRIEIRFEGPLFSGQRQSVNTIKIDFNSRIIKTKQPRLVKKLFSDVPPFVIVTPSLEEMLAEKIRALIMRIQPRDLYDIWTLLNIGVKINKKILKSKLDEDRIKSVKLVLPSKKEYERDLKQLLIYVPPYDNVAEYVTARFKDLKK